jgi:hypothetical protein
VRIDREERIWLDGRYEGYRAQHSDLLHVYDRWGADLKLGLHGPLTGVQVWQEMVTIAIQVNADSMPPGEGCHAGEQSWRGEWGCGAAHAGA